MKLIEPNVELIKQEPDIEGIYKQIERCARVCYKSEDKITDNSAKKFVDMLINNGHGAMLEHGTVYLKFKNDLMWHIADYRDNYSIINSGNFSDYYITTNFRVLIENGWFNDLQYLCEPTGYHEKRYTFKFITSRGIANELVRHRVFSFAQESSRYCNYSKDKFGNEVSFIIPSWLLGKVNECSYNTMTEDINFLDQLNYDKTLRAKASWYTSAFLDAERCYLEALSAGSTPQEARDILPLSTKTELCMTGFESDWKDFFKLRCDKAAHPDMQIIANKAKEFFPTHTY